MERDDGVGSQQRPSGFLFHQLQGHPTLLGAVNPFQNNQMESFFQVYFPFADVAGADPLCADYLPAVYQKGSEIIAFQMQAIKACLGNPPQTKGQKGSPRSSQGKSVILEGVVLRGFALGLDGFKNLDFPPGFFR